MALRISDERLPQPLARGPILSREQDNSTSRAQLLRFVYFAPADVQLARVDRICVVKFCEAMASQGADVTLVSLRIGVLKSEPTYDHSAQEVFGLRYPIKIISIPTPLTQMSLEKRWAKSLLEVIRAAAYPFAALAVMLRRSRSSGLTVLYAKNHGVAAILLIVRRMCARESLVLFEAHVPPRTRFQCRVLKTVDGVVCNGLALANALRREGLTTPGRFVGLHQGFDEVAYPCGNRDLQRHQARARLALKHSDRLVVYTGKVYWGYREVEYLLQAASQLAGDGIQMVIVGGREDHAQRWRDEVAGAVSVMCHFLDLWRLDRLATIRQLPMCSCHTIRLIQLRRTISRRGSCLSTWPQAPQSWPLIIPRCTRS